jgi:hypothetical protein
VTVDLALIVSACERFGAHRPEYRFAPPRKWRFDLAWPELLVAFEREGGTWQRGRHTRPAGYANDCEKYNAAGILGWIVIRATADMIQSGLALDQLTEALAVRAAQLNAGGES